MLPEVETVQAVAYIRPMGKPTMTQKSKHTKPSAVLYLQVFCPEIRAAFNRVTKFQSARKIKLSAYFKTEDPYLWDKPHDQKPDLTNILKGVEDALLIDDSGVAIQETSKHWAQEDRIEVVLYDVTY